MSQLLDFVVHPDEERADPAIWFHDDGVAAGKTYRYRIRGRLWNRYVGRPKAVQNLEDAKQAVLVGDWSLPSDPITVTPSTHFFVRSAKPGGEAATIDVWKWRRGEWIKHSFDVRAGDVIGGVKTVKVDDYDEDGKQLREDVDFTTDAIVLDLLFDHPVTDRRAKDKEGKFTTRETKSLIMVYLDPADGQVKEKVQLFDRYDPIKKMLSDEEF